MAGLIGVHVLVVLGLVWLMVSRNRRAIVLASQRRRVRRLPRSAIGDAVSGSVVKLQGTVVFDDEILESPMSNRDCALWSLAVSQWVWSTRRRDWRARATPILTRKAATGFFVEDETGRAYVAPVGAIASLAEDLQKEHRHDSAETEAIASNLHAACGVDLPLRPHGGALVFTEGTVAEGERVTVVGVARWEPAARGGGDGYRGGSKRLVIRHEESAFFFISNEPDLVSA